MRYFQEYRHKFSNAPGLVIDAGKKLLGYLSNQKRLSGVDSLIQRIAVTDEANAVWIVEARFDKDIPSVRVFPPGGSGNFTCELYVESGLLDLGANIASDASERFNRGLPSFAESPATLYFGTGVDCTDALNGSVFVTGSAINSECLSGTGDGIASRLTDPVKKQAQAVMPASNWSGLMQRYVQAVYGGSLLAYSATATALTIETASIPVADTIGLLNFSGTLAFLIIEESALTLRRCDPINSCVLAVLGAWRAMPASTDAERARKGKVLTIALSGCVVGEVIATGTIAATGNRHFPERSPWVFAHGANTAVGVFESGGVATAYQATFSLLGSTVSASLSTLTSGNVLNNDNWPLVVGCASPFTSPTAMASGFSTTDQLLLGDSYDFPVYAWYEGSSPRVASCSLVASDAAIADLSECYDATNLDGPVVIGSDETRKARSNLGVAASVSYGYYCDDWSTVSLVTAFVDDDTVLRVRDGGIQVIEPDPTLRTVSASYSPVGPFNASDFAALVASAALNGQSEAGCAVTNANSATLSATSNNLPENDCTTLYVYPDSTYMTGASVVGDVPYFDAYGAVFEGRVYACGVQLLSLTWGATSCFVVDTYDYAGGKGAYLSLEGASQLERLGSWAYSDATATGTVIQDVFTYDIPGDCSSSQTLTGPSTPFAAEFTKTMPPAESDLAITFKALASVFHDSGKLRVVHYLDTLAVTWNFATATVYPDPRYRGVETIKTSVFMGAASSLFDDTQQVDLALPGGSAYEHPSGVGTYVANDAAGGGEAFAYCGMQELTDSHTVSDLLLGDGESWVTQDLDTTTWLIDGFAYQAARSLLGATVLPTADLERGMSTAMDRQTITGGYAPVSTPSFVGWA